MKYVIYKEEKIIVKDNTLNLYRKGIKDISEIHRLEQLTSLKELNLSYNLISDIKGLDHLTHLECLNLEHNQISEIQGLQNLTKLRELYLQDNQITKIEGLDQLKNLEILNLYDNKIKKIEGLTNLGNLEKLNLRFNTIERIEGLEHLKNLETLRLGKIKSHKLEGLGRLYKLKHLSIDDWSIVEELKELGGCGPFGKIIYPQKVVKHCQKKENNPPYPKPPKLPPTKPNSKKSSSSTSAGGPPKLPSSGSKESSPSTSAGGPPKLPSSGSKESSPPTTSGGPPKPPSEWGSKKSSSSTSAGGPPKRPSKVSHTGEQEIPADRVDPSRRYITYMDEKIYVRHNILSLDKRGVESISELKGLTELTHLEELSLKDNLIEEINGLETLINLKTLNLKGNRISEIKGLGSLTKLRKLNLSGNPISKISGLTNLRNLRELNLAATCIKKIEGLSTLTKLTHLDLMMDNVERIEGLDNLINLETLKLSAINIRRIEGMGNLRNLKELYIFGAYNKKMFDKFGGLKLGKVQNPQKLVAYCRKRENIDSSSKSESSVKGSQEPNITKDEASRKLENLLKKEIKKSKGSPQGKSSPTSSSERDYIIYEDEKVFVENGTLKLDEMGIEDMGEIKGLEKLTSLKKLSLQGNLIEEIEGLENLRQLRELNLAENRVSEIKGLENLTELRVLDLENNQISEIKGLKNLSNLQTLNLEKNEIKQISGLNHLKNLEILKLSSNKIKRIEGLDYLVNLKVLDLKFNDIKRLEGLDSLVYLERLEFSRIKSKKIEGLGRLFNLKEFYIWDYVLEKKLKKITGIKYHKVLYPQKVVEYCQKKENLPSSQSVKPSSEKVSSKDSPSEEAQQNKPSKSQRLKEVIEQKKDELSWDDIGGLTEEVAQIRELIEYPIKYPELYLRVKLTPPKGIILYGPSGSGKTLIGKVLTAELDYEFTHIDGGSIMSKWYGKSEKNLKRYFKKAKQKWKEKGIPTIIFIDELDALTPKLNGSKHREVESRVIATLVTLMDGVTELGGIIVIGSTNRIHKIEPALRRSGRFETELYIGVPDKAGRREIFEIHLRDVPLSDDVDLDTLLEMSHGYTGADVNALVRCAKQHAIRRKIEEVDQRETQKLTEEDLENFKLTMEDFLAEIDSITPAALRDFAVDIPNVKWSDIGGLDVIIQKIKESVISPISSPQKFAEIGINPPSGILLFGPPGCGKTLLAKAIATESHANFLSVKGPEFLSKWVGESERAVRGLFEKARQTSPCIVFIDEADAITRTRNVSSHPSQTSDNLLTTLLVELDGLEPTKNVTVVLATNRPEIIDPALLRPGRIDRIFYIKPPDRPARRKIFEIHTDSLRCCDDLDLNYLAKHSEGLTGADIEGICREAGLMAVRNNETCIQQAHFTQALKDSRTSISDEMLQKYESLFKIDELYQELSRLREIDNGALDRAEKKNERYE
ncbi:MAG: AAA family ATPase, partial [Promethearchaeia archaeon]